MGRLLWLVLGLAGLGLGLELVRVVLGSNFATVVPGRVYRSAQLSPTQMREAVRRFGIRTVINLRGCCPQEGWYAKEAGTLRELGVAQVDVNFSSSMPPPVPELHKLVTALAEVEYPVLIHCRRGADRTSFAAACAALLEPGSTLADGWAQMSLQYGHSPVGDVQVLDECLATYPAWLAEQGLEHTPERFRSWVQSEYLPLHCWAEVTLAKGPGELQVGQWTRLEFRVTNRSRRPWRLMRAAHAGVHLRVFVRDVKTQTFLATGGSGFFDQIVPPGGSVELIVALPPLQHAGSVEVFADMSDEQMCWFHMVGSPPWTRQMEVKR
ncbi:MAG TPA: tyrosine-protein phosphatase [Gemmatales bacterium]|nr:tyrosine-protein phosphatase [Gemmatales bacterium]